MDIEMLTLTRRITNINRPVRAVARFLQIAVIVPSGIILRPTPTFALDDSGDNGRKNVPITRFVDGEQALVVGREDLRAGKIEASVAALTYAANNGQVIAQWKLGQMYAMGDGVARDDSRAYHFFNQVVESYDEDQPNGADAGAISDAFVAVGVYCLRGIPNSGVSPDPRRAHELFQYAATTFADPNAQYNLAHMYIVGTAGLPKDNITAIRWLALAANAGHPPSQALLGHMLFKGEGRLDQRVRGLMWLAIAKDGEDSLKDRWIHDLYQHDFREATNAERLAAMSMRDARAKATSSPPPRSRLTSLLQPFGLVPGNQ